MKMKKKKVKNIFFRKIQAAVLYVEKILAKIKHFGLYIDSGSFFEEKKLLLFFMRTFPNKSCSCFFWLKCTHFIVDAPLSALLR